MRKGRGGEEGREGGYRKGRGSEGRAGLEGGKLMVSMEG